MCPQFPVLVVVLLVPALAAAQGLGEKEALVPDLSLAGDPGRNRQSGAVHPAPEVDPARRALEVQLAQKRLEQIRQLEALLAFGSDPAVRFRLAELYQEESKSRLLEPERGQWAQRAIAEYSEIVQRHRDFARTDEVLYFLGQLLIEVGEERKGLIALTRLITRYPKSKHLAHAHFALGEFYSEHADGRREKVEKALAEYEAAAGEPGSGLHEYALYKQGWCYFQLGDQEKAMEKFKAVVLLDQPNEATLDPRSVAE